MRARDVPKVKIGVNIGDSSRDSTDPSYDASGNVAHLEVEHAPESNFPYLGVFRSLVSLLPGNIFLELAF
jgi:hypothetical protein